MSTTLQVLRQQMGKQLGFYRGGTTTSAGASNGTTAIDTSLKDEFDDRFVNWYLKLTSGDYSGQVRPVTVFAQATGTLTVATGFGTGAAAVATSVTYELYRYRPGDLDEHIIEAVRLINPSLFKRVVDDSLVTGNWLWDGSFEDWDSATALSHWTKSAAGLTLAKTTTKSLIRHGLTSAKMTASADDQYIEQSAGVDHRMLLDLAGQTVTLRGWVNADTASVAQIQLYVIRRDGTATTYTAGAVTGTNVWWLLEILDKVMPDDIQDIAIRVRDNTNAKIVYGDGLRLVGPPLYRYYLPASFIEVSQVWKQMATGTVQNDGTLVSDPCDVFGAQDDYELLSSSRWHIERDGTNKMLVFHELLPKNYKLRLVGKGFLSTLSADTDTVEIDRPQIDVLVAQAAVNFLQSFSPDTAEEVGKFQAMAQVWERKLAERKRAAGMVAPGIIWGGSSSRRSVRGM